MVTSTDQDRVDCIVRFHDIRRLRELDRSVFSLFGQTYRPLNIILMLQRFSATEVAATREALAPILALPGAPELTIRNLEQAAPEDARALLLNLGLEAAEGRYVGFLDYDDLLYPEAYQSLVASLRTTEAAVAFASVRVVVAEMYSQFIRVASELKDHFIGDGLIDLFRGNFCPIHSFLFDTHKINKKDLSFDPAMTWEEDYDLLLRICAKYPSTFGLVKTKIGEYYMKTDGSNTIPLNGIKSTEMLNTYEMVCAITETRRRMTIVAPRVQADLGIVQPQPDITIRRFLTRLEQC